MIIVIGSVVAVAATVRVLQQEDLAQRGHVMNLTRLWAWWPEVFEGFAALRAAVDFGRQAAPAPSA